MYVGRHKRCAEINLLGYNVLQVNVLQIKINCSLWCYILYQTKIIYKNLQVNILLSFSPNQWQMYQWSRPTHTVSWFTTKALISFNEKKILQWMVLQQPDVTQKRNEPDSYKNWFEVDHRLIHERKHYKASKRKYRRISPWL